jgi:hypothetical protein
MDVRRSSYAAMAKQYAEQVLAGEILACRWVQRACQRQLDDLAKFKGKASPYSFNPKLADKDGRSFYPADNLCAFIERLPHVKGPLAGEPIQLEPWPWIAMAMASTVCLLALLVSWMLDTPSGPTVVLMLAAFGVGALFYRKNEGHDPVGRALSEFESPSPPKNDAF